MRKLTFCSALLLFCSFGAEVALAQDPPRTAARAPIPGQLAQDFVAGRVPRVAEIAAAEQDVAADPTNLALARRLGKAHFFRFFGAGHVASAEEAKRTLERALELKSDDPETLVYYGSLWTVIALRLDEADPARQKANLDKGFALLQRAEKLAPTDGAVVSVAAASYVDLPASYGMAPHVVGMVEGMRKAMGPMFDRFSHHGRQRLLLTLGRAYAQTGRPDKARASFDEALKLNQESIEAELLKAELEKLGPPR